MKWFDNHAQDSDFMSQLEAATRLRPTTPVLLMLASVMALVIIFLVWAGVSKVEIITRGQGQVVPTQKIQIVQSFDGGIVADLLVKEGETVKKDQVLMRLSNTQFSSDEKEKEARKFSLMAKKARLYAEAGGQDFVPPANVKDKNPQIINNEQALYTSRKNELENSFGIIEDRIDQARAGISGAQSEISSLFENRALLQQQLKITSDMVRQKAAPKVDQIKLERELSDITGQINTTLQRKKGLEAELAEAQKQKKTQEGSFKSQALAELNQVEAEIAGLEENLKSAEDRVDRSELRAPVDGIVNSIAVSTIGGVVEPAMRLMEIVPTDDQLKIIAKVKPDQVAFLRTGQAAKVKITAYDAQKYGSLPGTLSRIGANSMTDRDGQVSFEIEVRTDKNYLGSEVSPMPISPGMVANVEVITGKRTILEYLLKPILRAQDVALTEH